MTMYVCIVCVCVCVGLFIYWINMNVVTMVTVLQDTQCLYHTLQVATDGHSTTEQPRGIISSSQLPQSSKFQVS